MLKLRIYFIVSWKNMKKKAHFEFCFGTVLQQKIEKLCNTKKHMLEDFTIKMD